LKFEIGYLKFENGNWKLDIRKSKLAIEITTSPPLGNGSILVEFRFSSFEFRIPVMANRLLKICALVPIGKMNAACSSSFEFPVSKLGNGQSVA
jgi:hypothetical protein